MKRHIWSALSLTAVVSFLLGLVAAGPGLGPMPAPARPVSPPLALTTTPRLEGQPPAAAPVAVDFSAVAARLHGAVVNVDASTADPDEKSRFVFPRRWSDDTREGAGSGFVIDPAGLVLTNYHVVANASRVTVTLRDGRALRATVLGIDPAIDVALLQVSSREPLPAAPLGRSNALRVGEWVCAIGNPLGYVHSVTVGVVSFMGRKVFDPGLDALIQTDAAITFGNSGGPLINVRGEVVGITTAISAQAANIGFAVPIDQVVDVLPQMRDTGRVTRGYLGVGLTSVTPALHRALQLGTERGAMVQDVIEHSPADRAGLRAYDVITGIDGRPIAGDEGLTRYVADRLPGTVTPLSVWRDGRMLTVPVKLAERPLPPSVRSQTAEAARVRPAGRSEELLGLSVTELDADAVKRRGLPETLAGVVINGVDPAGPSRITPIKVGQVLIEINRRPVPTVAHYRAVVAALAPGAPVALLVYDHASKQRLILPVLTDPR